MSRARTPRHSDAAIVLPGPGVGVERHWMQVTAGLPLACPDPWPGRPACGITTVVLGGPPMTPRPSRGRYGFARIPAATAARRWWTTTGVFPAASRACSRQIPDRRPEAELRTLDVVRAAPELGRPPFAPPDVGAVLGGGVSAVPDITEGPHRPRGVPGNRSSYPAVPKTNPYCESG